MRTSDNSPPAPDAAPHAVVLFDGVCNLCNGSINFIIDRDPSGYFRFAPLQSQAGQDLLRRHGRADAAQLKSVVLIDEHGRCHTRSAAALRIARRLRWPWPLAAVLVAVPPFLRDAAYEFVAANRYRWFGKTDACRVPTPDRARRFLDTAGTGNSGG